MTLSLNGWKGLSMAAFTIISIVGVATAVIMKERANQLYITCGVLFSAGVLLAGGFVHLLVDGNEQFEETGVANFPWAFSIAGGTILFLVCFELILDRVLDKKLNSIHTNDDKDENTVDETYDSRNVEEGTAEEALLAGTGLQHHGHINDDHDHSDMHGIEPQNPFSAIILTAALSIHGIIEGLGIGAAGDVSTIESAFLAVVCHKGFTAFALAEGMVTAGYWEDHTKRKYFYLSVGTFIFVSLLGIAIGWGISSAGNSSILTAVLTR